MANTYSHNCMMHRDTILKFGTLFYLAKYLDWSTHKSYSVRGTAGELVAPH